MRDAALFMGSPGDVVDADFGPGLPKIRAWTEAHSEFPGYIVPFDPAAFADREAVRNRLGFTPDDKEALAHAIADGLKRPVLYRDVETDGARRAAARIARLL